MNVHYFDALVGYFRSSGYFRIRKHLTNVGKIRILAGINVDRLIAEAARKGLEFMFNSEITLDEFTRNLRDDIQNADYEREVEEGILQFIADVANKKIEVRAHPDKNIHAKIYIFRQKVEHEHAGYGAVITGSSNLTEQGIEKNIEFNVELRDYDDIKYALETFEKLWEESVSALSTDCRSLIKETYLNNEFTPFEIYIKLLAEYFGNSIEYDPESIGDLPKGV
jgi:HKD family nuclease